MAASKGARDILLRRVGMGTVPSPQSIVTVKDLTVMPHHGLLRMCHGQVPEACRLSGNADTGIARMYID